MNDKCEDYQIIFLPTFPLLYQCNSRLLSPCGFLELMAFPKLLF